MKMCLIFENKMIPPSASLVNPNPKIRWDEIASRSLWNPHLSLPNRVPDA